MIDTDYFVKIGKLQERFSTIKKDYTHFVEECIEAFKRNSYDDYQFISFESSNQKLIDHLDENIGSLRKIKDELRALLNDVDKRSKTFLKPKHGNVKKKLNLVLSESDVVDLTRNVKDCKMALEKMVNRKQIKLWLDFLESIEDIAQEASPNPK